MTRIIAAFNMTLDGFCDHNAVNPDEEIHQHYADLLSQAGAILYGRTTYQLMEYWRTLIANPSGDKSADAFAVMMDRIPKIVFSHTLKSLDWNTARLADKELKDEVSALRTQLDKDIFVGSRSLIIQLMNLGLIDELQLMVHPVIAAGGLPLFENINGRTVLKLSKTKNFGSGAVIHYYRPADRD